MRYLFLFLIFISSAEAFTLNNNFAASFKKNRVNVYVAGISTCSNLSISPEELRSYIKPAIENFWNKVPTSRLRMKDAGFYPFDGVNDFNTFRLCSPTDSACINDASSNSQGVLAGVEGIVISCNQTADNFDGNSVIAVTVPNAFSGKKIKGAVILINDQPFPGGKFRDLSRDDRIGVIAHEIGHALGLGHSEVKEALMYYQVVDVRKSLGQDDIDGITYLYPIKLDGCGLVDGLVASTLVLKKHKDDDDQSSGGGGNSFWQMGIGFFLMIVAAQVLKLLKRPQARSAF